MSVPSLPFRERYFAGSEAMSYEVGYHTPEDIAEARKLFPDNHIDDNGDVRFYSRSEERRFKRKQRELKKLAL